MLQTDMEERIKGIIICLKFQIENLAHFNEVNFVNSWTECYTSNNSRGENINTQFGCYKLISHLPHPICHRVTPSIFI